MPSPCWNSILVAACLLAAMVPATAAPTACPATAEVTQQAEGVPEGFTPYITTTHHPLVSIQISDGPPDGSYWLVPDRYHEEGKYLVAYWRFIPGRVPSGYRAAMPEPA